MGYIKIVSWHIVRNWTRVPGRAETRCGRTADGQTTDSLPGDEKSCESCLRYARQDADRA
jgi:hypothetical protein